MIEDDNKIANLICHVATEMGFTAHAATGPEAIIKAYESLQPEVIIMDLFMPDMDGIEVLQFLRRQFSPARIVIISGSDVSSRRMTESLGKGLGLIIEANISKPFQIAELRATLEKIKLSFDKTT